MKNYLSQKSFNKISKTGLLENDRKLTIQKFGLSKLKIIKKYYSSNDYTNNPKLAKSVPNLKIGTKKKIKNSLLIELNDYNNNYKKRNNNNISTFTKIKNTDISLNTTNDHIKKINALSEFKKLSECLSKKNVKPKIMQRINKSCASIKPIKQVLNINTMTNSSINKRIKMIKETKINFVNSNYMTTAQNTFKTSKNSNNIDSLFISPPIEQNKKTINKINFNYSTPNLFKAKNQTKKNIQEKSYKNKNTKQRTSINKNKNSYNINNYNNNNKYKPIIKTSNNLKYKKIQLIKPFDVSKDYLKTNVNNFNKKRNTINHILPKFKSPKNNNNNNNNNNNKKPQLSIITQSDIVNKEVNLDEENSKNSKNSDDTKKESRLDLQKYLNDRILKGLNNKNNIYDIISINMHRNCINNQSNKTNNSKINDQDTVNVEEEEDNENYNIINIHKNNENFINKKKNLIFNPEQQKVFNILNLQKEMQNINQTINNNLLNFSDINENVNINYNMLEENNRKEQYDQFYFNINNLQIMNNQIDFQSSQDKNNDQTQTTYDRYNIISKYIKQPIYNISPRFFSTEKPSISKYTLKNNDFIFINDIEKNNKNIPIINIKKILSLKDKSIFRLLSFSYDSYSAVVSSTNLLKKKFNNSLKKIFQNTIKDFQKKYSNFLKISNFSFQHKKFINNHKNNSLFNLIIKCQIITKEVKKSYEIGCNYISNGKSYDNLWKFDVHKKKDIKLWICTELSKINNSYKKFSYTSQVSSFSYQDELELEFNIFSKGNSIDPETIEWTSPTVSEAGTGIFKNSNFISAVKFDQLRACEVETQVLFWKNVIQEDDKRFVDDVLKIFEKFFEVRDIYYYVSKFHFFKFEMIANKIGALKQNKYLSFDINIIEYESNIKNEIQCIYLVNNNYFNKSMDIRLGTLITFYIIDMI